MDHNDWSSRRPTSNIMDYASPTDDEHETLARVQSQAHSNRFYTGHGKARATQTRPRPIASPTPSVTEVPTMPIPIPTNPNVIPGNTLPSAPASPPTPAPSPTPMGCAPDWSTADPREDFGDLDLNEDDNVSEVTSAADYGGFGYRHMRSMFASMSNDERQRMLGELLNMCDGKLLGFVAGFVGPRLKRDPLLLSPHYRV